MLIPKTDWHSRVCHIDESELAEATIEMDGLTFNRLSSGRLSDETVLAWVNIEDDRGIAA
jgi:hypothetical protein